MLTVAFDTPITITSHLGNLIASAISWRVVIRKDGKEYLPTGDFIYQLHESNTFKQSQWLKEQGKSWVSPPTYIDPDVKPCDFPIPAKTAFILAALQATDKPSPQVMAA